MEIEREREREREREERGRRERERGHKKYRKTEEINKASGRSSKRIRCEAGEGGGWERG